MDFNNMDMWTTSPFEQPASQGPARTSTVGTMEYDYEIINRMIAGSAMAKKMQPTWAINPEDDDAALISKMILGSKHHNNKESPLINSSKVVFFWDGLLRRSSNNKYSGKSQC